MPRTHRCKAKGCNKTVDRTYRSTAQVCSILCAVAWGREKDSKKADKAHRAAKRSLKANDRSFQLKGAQAAFNRYIRLRDEGLDCISCAKPPKKKNAGHFKSRGSYPELRFEEFNCALQCEYCNTHLSGNLANYRVNLIKRIGVEKVEWLEGSHERLKLTIDDIKAIQEKYKAKIKELEEA